MFNQICSASLEDQGFKVYFVSLRLRFKSSTKVGWEFDFVSYAPGFKSRPRA